MKLTNNTILITGGGTGIGRGLAEAFHKLGNKVIITGRREKLLHEVADANPGMAAVALDVDSPKAIHAFAAEVTELHPALNILINNAGTTRREDLKTPNATDSEAIITTNLLGPIRLTAALLPHLQKQSAAAVINVSSGLGFVPLPLAPTYSATKAALHSLTESLRVAMRGTSVEVIEIIPPAVATDLTPNRYGDPRYMPLDEYIAEVMQNFKIEPTPQEILVERVKFLRFAAATGSYDKALAMLAEFQYSDGSSKLI